MSDCHIGERVTHLIYSSLKEVEVRVILEHIKKHLIFQPLLLAFFRESAVPAGNTATLTAGVCFCSNVLLRLRFPPPYPVSSLFIHCRWHSRMTFDEFCMLIIRFVHCQHYRLTWQSRFNCKIQQYLQLFQSLFPTHFYYYLKVVSTFSVNG